MYYNLAQECIKHGTFYPAEHNLNDAYIIAPFYVNYIILLLHIYNSPSIIIFFNILLNLLNLWFIRKITFRLFNRQQYVNIVTILYIFYLSSLGAVFMNVTELLFCLFILAGYYLMLGNTGKNLFFAGILTGLAFATRQSALALILGWFLVSGIHKRFKPVFNTVLLVSGFGIALGIFGLFTRSQSGRFVISPNTGSLNMLIGANDDATGAYNNIVFEKGRAGYIENFEAVPYFEKADYWKAQTINWIKANPVKWLLLLPKKLVHMFIWDDWSIHTLLKTNDWNLYIIGKTLMTEKSFKPVFAGESMLFKIAFILVYTLHHIIYYAFLILMIYQFYYYYKNNKPILSKCIHIYLFSLISIGVILLAFGAPRYKHPMFIMMLITLVPMISNMGRFKMKKGG